MLNLLKGNVEVENSIKAQLSHQYSVNEIYEKGTGYTNQKHGLNYKNMDKLNCFEFQIGNTVRISKVKHVLEKGNTPNWTKEVFVISLR